VREALRATQFRPNRAGRALKTAKSRTIGVLVPTLRNPVFADAVEGMDMAAEASNYNVLLASSRYSREREIRAIETLLENRVDGVLLTVSDEANSPALALLRKESCPFVLLFNPTRRGEAGVTIDNATAAERIVETLIARGHRRIDMVAGSIRQSDRSRLRRAGYWRALERHGLPQGKVVEVDIETTDISGPLSRLCSSGDPPTALFCSTDMLAISAMRALSSMHKRVPEDMAVAGFDGIAPGRWISPTLATVVQPAQEIGRAGFEHLVARIERGVAPRRLNLSYELHLGESLGPPHPESI
jgi:DNA-binding LacI/PurR family transcriptional regulator